MCQNEPVGVFQAAGWDPVVFHLEVFQKRCSTWFGQPRPKISWRDSISPIAWVHIGMLGTVKCYWGDEQMDLNRHPECFHDCD